jgi:hypothetical protein
MIMKHTIYIILLICILPSCNNSSTLASKSEASGGNFRSEKINGKYSVDFATGEELKGMRITIENFTLLNKKKFENLKAYQQFGDIMQNHLDRLSASCGLDADSRKVLFDELNKFKGEISVLHGDDMSKSKEAVHRINAYLSKIDSTFNYNN